jgi:hypothetical protein
VNTDRKKKRKIIGGTLLTVILMVLVIWISTSGKKALDKALSDPMHMAGVKEKPIDTTPRETRKPNKPKIEPLKTSAIKENQKKEESKTSPSKVKAASPPEEETQNKNKPAQDEPRKEALVENGHPKEEIPEKSKPSEDAPRKDTKVEENPALATGIKPQRHPEKLQEKIVEKSPSPLELARQMKEKVASLTQSKTVPAEIPVASDPFSDPKVEIGKFEFNELVKNQIIRSRENVDYYPYNINNRDRHEIYELMKFRPFVKSKSKGYFFDLLDVVGYDLNSSKSRLPDILKTKNEFLQFFGNDLIAVSTQVRNEDMNRELRAKFNDSLDEVITKYERSASISNDKKDFKFFYVPPVNMFRYMHMKNKTFVEAGGYKNDDSLKIAGVVYKVRSGAQERGIYFPLVALKKKSSGGFYGGQNNSSLEDYLKTKDIDFKEIGKGSNALNILATLVQMKDIIHQKYK